MFRVLLHCKVFVTSITLDCPSYLWGVDIKSTLIPSLVSLSAWRSTRSTAFLDKLVFLDGLAALVDAERSRWHCFPDALLGIALAPATSMVVTTSLFYGKLFTLYRAVPSHP